ncbi:T9SS type A sorting domain-containing protein [Flavobacteriaceae bacterium]|jgi:cytochrome c peroxidase|nr:T9SS type A sorting domain-containing protein [Flavobacteriaceae bacterium]MDC3318676.1 T9SS type A sorting domain-containing protein [Flavobacteriaceae bacterium]
MKKISKLVTLIGLLFILISGTIDLDDLFNYETQNIPSYITKDNTPETNQINNEITTLGRVLFYDKNLSENNTIACASCHQQAFAFSDPLTSSVGLNGGNTGRHSMRLVNSRFSNEEKFFWDERATSLENQVTQPIQDHIEMGFSGTNGDPDFNELIAKLSAIDYYQTLFDFAYGNSTINEDKIQRALSQFIRSIQSFDSKFDEGFLQSPNLNAPFPNYTPQENLGKQLFLNPPPNGGAGCAGCHAPPEFDIDPNTLNNGVIGVIGSTTEVDLTNTRSPSLRDLVNPDGSLNGPLMHDGSMTSLLQVINHYNSIPNNPANNNLDNRLQGPGNQTQQLNLTINEKSALEAFLKTLSGSDIYTNEKWSDPFDEEGNISIVGGQLSINENSFEKSITVFPNPVETDMSIQLETGNYTTLIYNLQGKILYKKKIFGNESLNLQILTKGIYLLLIKDNESSKVFKKRFIKL